MRRRKTPATIRSGDSSSDQPLHGRKMRDAQQQGDSMGRTATSTATRGVAPSEATAVSVKWAADPLANAIDHLAEMEREERLAWGGDEADPPASEPTILDRLRGGWGSWDA